MNMLMREVPKSHSLIVMQVMINHNHRIKQHTYEVTCIKQNVRVRVTKRSIIGELV